MACRTVVFDDEDGARWVSLRYSCHETQCLNRICAQCRQRANPVPSSWNRLFGLTDSLAAGVLPGVWSLWRDGMKELRASRLKLSSSACGRSPGAAGWLLRTLLDCDASSFLQRLPARFMSSNSHQSALKARHFLLQREIGS